MLLLALTTTALAADAHPGVLTFSARPSDGPAVDMSGFGGVVIFNGTVAGGMLRGSFAPSDRFTVDLRTSVIGTDMCDFRCTQRTIVDGVVRTGYAVVDRPHVRVMPYLGAGRMVEAGVALWVSSPDDRFEFDAAWGPSFWTEHLIPGKPDRWSEVENPAPNFIWREETSIPELGLTVHLDTRDVHHLRFGHFGPVPSITYRADPGKVNFELTVGAAYVANFVAGGVGGSF